MLLTVIIVNWNSREFLGRCLETVFASNFKGEYEVIVVDNRSSDDSVAFVRERYPQVRLIANEENVGFARANNQAIRESGGEYILLLNPDTEIEADTLQVMVDFMKIHPEAGMAGCRVLNHDGSLQPACRRAIPTLFDAFCKLSGLSRLFPRSPRFTRYNLAHLPEDRLTPVDAVSGSFMFTRREVVERIGLLDEQFFMYGEDLDWCRRALDEGYRNYYVPDTTVIHYHGQSSKKRPLRTAYQFYRAMALFYCKHSAPRWIRPLVTAGALFCFLISLPKIIITARKRRQVSIQAGQLTDRANR